MLLFHALLYDDFPGLMASALDTDLEHLGPRHLPRNLWRGLGRLKDLVTRYQP